MTLSFKTGLLAAQSHAQSGRFPDMLATCQHIIQTHSEDVDALLNVGTLLLSFGYLTRARECFERVGMLAPNDLRAVLDLANLARDTGEHAQSLRLYADLQALQPNNSVIRRNCLVSQEYDPSVSDAQRLQQARAWGDWAIEQAGGWRSRPLPPWLLAAPCALATSPPISASTP